MAEGWIVASYYAFHQPVGMIPFGWSDAIYFGCDPLGRCVKPWAGSSGDVYSNPATYFNYDGWNLLQEGVNAWGPARVYVHGNRMDEVVWSYNTSTGEQAYHHYEARGHCTVLTDSSGSILEQYEYDAFGWPYFCDASGKSIGSYDAQGTLGGRFLQPDSKEFSAGDYNLYRYCHNDPVNKSDPFGLKFIDCDAEIVDAVPGMFGKTEFALQAGVGVVFDKNAGTFSLQVAKYDVIVTLKEIAATANGEKRTPQEIDCTRDHENLHTSDMKALHDSYQNKVLRTGYATREDAVNDAQSEADKLNRDFGAAEYMTNLHEPDPKWKEIIQGELPKK
jgi:hypothetical protein